MLNPTTQSTGSSGSKRSGAVPCKIRVEGSGHSLAGLLTCFLHPEPLWGTLCIIQEHTRFDTSHTHTFLQSFTLTGRFSVANLPTIVFLAIAENQRTWRETSQTCDRIGKTLRKLCPELRIEPQVMELWGELATLPAVPPCHPLFKNKHAILCIASHLSIY